MGYKYILPKATRTILKSGKRGTSLSPPLLFFTTLFYLLFLYYRFNTRSLFKLAQISGIVKFSCLQTFGSKPYAWHPTSARAYYGLRKVSEWCKRIRIVIISIRVSCSITLLYYKEGCRKGSNNVKQVAFDFANERESPAYLSYSWDTTSDGELLKTNFDVTDAYLMAIYTCVLLLYHSCILIPNLI